jgi:hypothetical protein
MSASGTRILARRANKFSPPSRSKRKSNQEQSSCGKPFRLLSFPMGTITVPSQWGQAF